MRVFSFDRDGTVDVNPLSESHESIPLEWVQYLAHETENEVWAHGNQALKKEAGIPGKSELIREYTGRWGDPIKHVNQRNHKDLEDALQVGTDPKPDPDLVTAASEWQKGGSFAKQQYLRLLMTLYPDAEEYVCVDNQYLGYVPGWTYYYPAEFVNEFEWVGNKVAELGPEWEPPKTPYREGDRNVRTSTRVVSWLGRKCPRNVRDRFELTPSNRFPIRFRKE